MDVTTRAKRIKLLIMDVDGTLTDGRLFFGPTGEELKVFNVRDGQGLTAWHEAGGKSGVISGRNSPIVDLRMTQLGVEFVWQGRNDKAAAFTELIAAAGVTADETAFIGDDTPDAELFPLVGLAVAVADAQGSVIAAAHYVTKSDGGRGAVRDLVDMLLAARS
ncbi:MAG TPA: HAD hydrolase family protein [Pyrinomonadaceae bacterium]|nr:HAD hydrolase family protein [Pyrinomonadaceae bacterium]